MRKGAYVYDLVVDGVRRYVGKGRGNRCHAHMKKVRSIARRRAAGEVVATTPFYEKLTHAWLDGAEIAIYVLVDGLSDAEAFKLETTLIEQNKDSLWNMTPGGQGFSAEQWADPAFREKMASREESKRTAEFRAKRSAMSQSMWDDPEWRAKEMERRRVKSERLRLNKQAAKAEELKQKYGPSGSWNEYQKAKAQERRQQLEEERRTRREAGLRLSDGKPLNTSTRFSTENLRKPHTPEENARVAASNKETWSDPKLLAEQSERSKLIWLRPEYQAKLTGRQWTPEMKQEFSKTRADQWNDPVYRAKQMAAKTAPESHGMRSDAAKRGWDTRRTKQR